jgi:hypothetical protein
MSNRVFPKPAEDSNRHVRRGSEWECVKCGRGKVTEPAHVIRDVPRCCNEDMRYMGGKFMYAADMPLSSEK